MLRLPGFDHCLLGLCESADGIFRLAYSTELIIDTLCLAHDWNHEQAQDYFDAHFLDIPGDRGSPTFITQMDMSMIEDMVEECERAIKRH